TPERIPNHLAQQPGTDHPAGTEDPTTPPPVAHPLIRPVAERPANLARLILVILLPCREENRRAQLLTIDCHCRFFPGRASPTKMSFSVDRPTKSRDCPARDQVFRSTERVDPSGDSLHGQRQSDSVCSVFREFQEIKEGGVRKQVLNPPTT